MLYLESQYQSKMTEKRISTVIMLLLAAIFRVFAIPEPSTAHIKVISVNDGLPDNSVNDLAEDDYGFIWIATWNGLARFDGRHVTVFRHEHGNADNPPSDMVRCVRPGTGGLWVGFDTGLDFFSYADGTFHPTYYYEENGDEGEVPLNTRVSRVLVHGGNVYALSGEGDLLKLDPGRSAPHGTRAVFRRLPRPRTRRYSDLSGFAGNRLLMLSNEGVTLLAGNGESELAHNPLPLSYDPNLNMFFDRSGMTVTVGAGVGSGTYRAAIDGNGRLTRVETAPEYSNLMSVAADGDTQYYGTDGNGMFVREGDRITRFTPDNSLMPCDAIYKVFVDSNHNLWIGSYRHGVFMLSHNLNAYSVIDKSSGLLSYDIVTAVIPDGDRLFLGLDGGGIEMLDTRTGSHWQFTRANSQLPADNVVSMVKDGDRLWAAIYGTGLVECDITTGACTTYRAPADIEPGNKLWALAEDADGNLWVGGKTLSVFDRRTHQFRAVEGTQMSDVLSMAVDGNTLLASTRWNGILEIDRRRRALVEKHSASPSKGGVRLPGRRAPFVFIDSRHRVWADIDNTRLCRIDPGTRRIEKTYALGSGNTRVQVLSMVEDRHGNLLIGTNTGLLKYIREKDMLIPLNDERMPRMFTFNASASCDDTAYFGTTAGLVRYPLDQTVENRELFPTVFTGLEVFSGDGKSMPLFSWGDTTLRLDSDQNFFKVSFTVPEMTNPGQLKFECRLEGLEEGWRDVTDTRAATYTYVPSGKYRLMVRHTMPDGGWSEPAAITIRIKAPWYATPWMIVVWILLFCIVTVTIGLIWHKFIRNREKMRIAEVERESDNRLAEAKLDFYANITHELRTPCFLISAQIEEMYDSGRQSVPVSNLGGIYRNSAKLNKLISHIIDFRKTDTGHLRLNARRIDVQALLGELAADYEQLCRQKSLAFDFSYSDPPVEAEVDPDKLELIITNLISNAYKYTRKGGTVSLDLKENDDTIEISVTDNGIGIVDKLQTTIFEPFVRTERGQKVSSGDGIGLSFVKELVELHHGTITVDSKVNEGSRFTVTLPKKQTETLSPPIDFQDISGEMRKPALLMPESQEEAGVRISDPTATRSILLIDDNPDVLSVVAKAFGENYRVTEMSDAREAFELACQGGFDVVVTDLMMPDYDGHQLLKALKADKRTRDIKVVVFSALTSENDMLTAFDEGADAYLTKPIPIKVLVKQVERLFDQGGDTAAISASAGNYNREEQKFLLECRRIINECMTDEEFGITMLSQRLSMSHSALYKKIKSMTGMSIIDFINEYRIYKAVQLFRDGITNVQAVAEMCGFRDVKTFRETFKRKMQMPPKQYMLKIREK